ncbi:unnamed protein product [Symbiodinium sp. KB8]|nr:unnamed protein product [Symbiodinium sp. KB8]
MRRPAADHVARRAAPYVFDLAPWRFSLGELRLSIKAMDERAQTLQAEVFQHFQSEFRDPNQFDLPSYQEFAQFLTPRINLTGTAAARYPPEAVLVLHEQCKYTGCTLSPYLFALFTCHLYDEIAQRTNTAWAQAALTLFADDTHLAWDIHSTEVQMALEDDQMDAQAALARRELETVFGAQPWASVESEKKPENDQEQEDGDRPPKWRRDGSKGKGQSYSAWEGWQRGKRQWPNAQGSQDSQAAATESPQTQELVKTLVKVVVRHEQELMRLRPDVGYIAFCDTSEMGCMGLLHGVAKEWAEQFAQGTVKTSIKVILAMAMMKDLRERAEKALREEEQLQRCMNVGWCRAGETMDPVWVYHTWDPKEKKQVVADTPPLKHSEALRLIDTLLENLPKEGVLTKFGSTKRLDLQEKFTTEVVPMMLQVSLRGQASDLCYNAMRALSGNAIAKLQGVRWRPERAHQPPLAKALEEAYLAVPYCRQFAGTAHEGVPVPISTPAISLATRNELVLEAKDLLDAEAWRQFLMKMEHLHAVALANCIVTFPPPCYADPATCAEQLAETFLLEGAGSLWSAVREVVRALEFEQDHRDSANGATFRLGLYSKGGILGVARNSWRHVATCRLLNAAILSICGSHTWTSISVNMDNGMGIHLDKHNAPGRSLLVGLSHHTQGELWVKQYGGPAWLSANGIRYSGQLFPTSASAVLFDGRTSPHGTMQWTRNRCVLVAYTVGRRAEIDPPLLQHLLDAGFVPPTESLGTDGKGNGHLPGQSSLSDYMIIGRAHDRDLVQLD